jgi:anti-sigma factor RsiW
MEHQRAVQNLAVESYLLGEMSPRERDAFEEHFFECSVCGDDVRAAAKFMEVARDILGEGVEAESRLNTGRPLPDSPQLQKSPGRGRTPGWLIWLKPQFAAPALAALLLVVSIQSLRIIPNLQRQVAEAFAPRVAASIVLRRAVRGESSRLAVPADSAVLLTLDLPEPPATATPLQFVIESVDGVEALRVRGNAPEPGRLVNVLIPRLSIQSGAYTVVVEHAAEAGKRGQELGRFPFQLELQ